MSDILKHLKGFEKNQNELGDRYGAEILHNAGKEISRLTAEVRVANEAFQESDAACADLEEHARMLEAYNKRLAGQNTTMRAVLQIIKPEALEAMDAASTSQCKNSQDGRHLYSGAFCSHCGQKNPQI